MICCIEISTLAGPVNIALDRLRSGHSHKLLLGIGQNAWHSVEGLAQSLENPSQTEIAGVCLHQKIAAPMNEIIEALQRTSDPLHVDHQIGIKDLLPSIGEEMKAHGKALMLCVGHLDILPDPDLRDLFAAIHLCNQRALPVLPVFTAENDTIITRLGQVYLGSGAMFERYAI